MNVELLKRVADVIVQRPCDFQMASIAIDLKDSTVNEIFDVDKSCGTACCIAGWAICLDGSGNPGDVDDSGGIICILKAEEILGLTSAEGWHLFILPGWPWVFSNAYRLATTDEERGRIAYDRINHFIATEGQE